MNRMKKARQRYGILPVLICLAYASFLFTPAMGQSTAPHRGFGPIKMKTPHGEFAVRLLKRDKDVVWLLQRTQSGEWIEAGVNASDIESFEVPSPRIFQYVDVAETPDQVYKVMEQLDKFIATLKPYRGLPGIPADQALLLKGKLLQKLKRWKEALAIYQNLYAQDYTPGEANEARLRAGLCRAELGQTEAALEDFEEGITDDEDLVLLSDVYYTKGKLLAESGHHKEAVMSYLYLVVFYPFVENNEPRCLEGALNSYIVMKDWEAAYKTVLALSEKYPDSDYSKKAQKALEPYKEELKKEQLFVEPVEAEPMEPDISEPEKESEVIEEQRKEVPIEL